MLLERRAEKSVPKVTFLIVTDAGAIPTVFPAPVYSISVTFVDRSRGNELNELCSPKNFQKISGKPVDVTIVYT